MLKVAIVGCGWAGKQHAEAFHKNSGTYLAAVSDKSIDTAKALGEKFSVPGIYTSHEKLLKNESIDLLAVCTPTSTHLKIFTDASKYVKNFLIEKPMALSARQCDEIIVNARKNNINVCVAHNRLFFPAIMKAKDLIEAGRQEGILAKATFYLPGFSEGHWKTTEEEGGMLWEEGAHAAYLLPHFLPKIIEVEARGSKNDYQVYDEIRAVFRCTDKSLGLLDLKWGQKPRLGLELFTLGNPTFAIDLDYRIRNPVIVQAENSTQFIKKALKVIPGHLKAAMFSKLGLVKIKKPKPLSYHYELIDSFVRTINEGQQPPVTAEQGRNAIRLLECIYQSMETGSKVKYT